MPPRQKKQPRVFIFTLNGVNTDEIDLKYGLSNTSDKQEQNERSNITKISDLNSESHILNTLTFLGNAKETHKCQISLIDFKTKTPLEPNKYNCFWCRHPFSTIPIGCPISYIPNKIQKTYMSASKQTTYVIDEETTLTKVPENIDAELINNSCYYTDGAFCSFNCCGSYIKDNRHNPFYNNSYTLLVYMYNEMFTCNISSVPNAPNWRTLIPYGGNMNIKEFRESFDNAEYVDHGNVRDIVDTFVPIGTLFEKKLKF